MLCAHAIVLSLYILHADVKLLITIFFFKCLCGLCCVFCVCVCVCVCVCKCGCVHVQGVSGCGLCKIDTGVHLQYLAPWYIMIHNHGILLPTDDSSSSLFLVLSTFSRVPVFTTSHSHVLENVFLCILAVTMVFIVPLERLWVALRAGLFLGRPVAIGFSRF